MQYAVSQSISVSVGFCLVSVSVLVFGRFTYGISKEKKFKLVFGRSFINPWVLQMRHHAD